MGYCPYYNLAFVKTRGMDEEVIPMSREELNSKFFIDPKVRTKNYDLWKQGDIILIAREHAPQQVSICIRNKETPELTLVEAHAYARQAITRAHPHRSADTCEEKDETT